MFLWQVSFGLGFYFYEERHDSPRKGGLTLHREVHPGSARTLRVGRPRLPIIFLLLLRLLRGLPALLVCTAFKLRTMPLAHFWTVDDRLRILYLFNAGDDVHVSATLAFICVMISDHSNHGGGDT